MDEHKVDLVGLIGQGLIYQKVKHHVESIYQTVPCTMESSPQQLAACKIIVYCSDTWSPRTLQEINRRCLQAGVALLPVATQFEEAVIGPCVVPHQQGCTSCAELRTLGAISAETDRELLHQYRSKERELAASQPWLSSFGLETLTVLVGKEIATYLQRPDQIQTGCALLTVSLAKIGRAHV